jgi:hypothetical protein
MSMQQSCLSEEPLKGNFALGAAKIAGCSSKFVGAQAAMFGL